ncbi:putative histone deacetylase transcription factor C2H2 family [Helianthus annuus]|nr:putative histone deacetylase transcription factor C2H2 family [Helianthus annuus]
MCVEVKSGQPLEVKLGEGKVLHLSQACLGELKNNKPSDSVYLHINIESKKLVLGTLNSERLPQQLFDLVIDKDFTLSHNWKNGSVYFYGYQADQPIDESELEEESDSDEEDALPLPVVNGKKEDKPVVVKQEEKKEAVPAESKKKDDEDDEDSSDSEDSSDEEEETPKKQQSGKKRANESAMKTPASDKKAKLSTPQKTDGKKAGGHVATPHPSKQTKTPANKSNQKSPASASTDGAHSCKPCNRTFKSDSALQSHNQAKHK